MAPEPQDLLEKVRDLKERLEEAEELLRALRNGEVDAVVVYGEDGDRVYTLKGADEAYRKIVQEMGDGALTLRPDGLILFANERFARMVGKPLERVIGSTIQDFVASEDSNVLAALLAGRNGRKAEMRLSGAGGDLLVPVYISADNLMLDGVDCFCLIVTDLTEQKRSEEILAAEKLARSILEQAAEAILVLDPEGCILRASSAAEGLAGESVFLRNFDEVFPIRLSSGAACSYREILETVCQKGPIRSMEAVAEIAGRRIELLLSAARLSSPDSILLGCVVTLTDITERKTLERKLAEKQKLESIGLLAGGIAHDFNNLLVGILGNASLAQEMLPAGSPVIRVLDGVVNASERAAHLTREMLAYSGKGQLLIQPVNLSQITPEVTRLIESSISNRTLLRFELAADLPPVSADVGQIQQVIMNLVINAAEAIGDEPGVITIRTGVQEVDGDFLRGLPDALEIQPGQYVSLEVCDTGHGMDEATKARIFDPFFSTKFTGRGLGLAAVWGIVRGHKGALKVTSAPGKGSTFLVLFPAAEASASKPEAPAPATGAVGGPEPILVVDDEPIVLRTTKAALEQRGFQVLRAESGKAAIETLKRERDRVSIVVLDLSMPGMSGQETLLELRRIKPAIEVIVSSGYSESEALRIFSGQHISAFLQKPFSAARLAEKIQAVIRSRVPARS